MIGLQPSPVDGRRYQVNDRVVLPAHGVGYVVALTMQRFFNAEARLYYEIAIQRNTIWVPVDMGLASGLRPVTPKSELEHYRNLLLSRPIPLEPDHHKRHLNLVKHLKGGLFQNLCEVVRDLNARRWLKPLNDVDSSTFRRTRENLCLEWAAVDEVTLPDATQEIEALLLRSRETYQR